jgi:hypothetical protein
LGFPMRASVHRENDSHDDVTKGHTSSSGFRVFQGWGNGRKD